MDEIVPGMDLGFRGEVADLYHRYRHGYPGAVLDALRDAFGLTGREVVTVGQALHWMKHLELFRAIIPLVRPGGGVAVVTNGTPLWRQDTHWSRALRNHLEHWLGTRLTSACGTDEQSQRRYRNDLVSAGFEVIAMSFDYVAELDLNQLVGGIYSALPVTRLPAQDQRPEFAEQIGRAVAPHEHFSEHVHVAILVGRRAHPRIAPGPGRP